MFAMSLALAVQAMLSGSLMAEGKPAAGATLALKDTAGTAYSATVDDSGKFAFQVPAGTYEFVLERVIGKENRTVRIPKVMLEDGDTAMTLAWPEGGTDDERRTLLRTAFDQGTSELGSGKYEAALASFDKALRADFAQPQIWGSMALAHVGLKQYDKAVETGMMAMRFGPGEAVYRNNLGATLFRMSRFRDSAKRFVEAADLNPAGVGMYCANAGAAYLSMGDEKGALAMYLRAAADANAPADAFFQCGALMQKTGDRDGAVKMLRKYLEVAPTGPRAADVRERLKSLGG